MLIQGPFESDYSLAIVNRRLALALLRAGRPVRLHQRDNTTDYPPSTAFLAAHPELAPWFVPSIEGAFQQVHSRYIYPPYTDRMVGMVRAVHCYGWEESAFPQQYVGAFNRDLDVITVMSTYVREVLEQNGVRIPIEVVGLGADHILENDSQPADCLTGDAFHFVHVSSCFPRKGADVLVRAFCREFSRGENVRLIIKTFANPHNRIDEIVDDTCSRYPRHAPIKVVLDSFSPGQMRYLIENGNCLVAPSRGEGFGLPVAEAMLLGTPVIATMHGGHADLCSPDWCWPVDYQLARAQTHLTEGESFWAEPNEDSLASRMREVYESGSDAIRRKTALASEHIREHFSWERTALRHEEACTRILRNKTQAATVRRSPRAPCHIGFVSTWNARCGIAEYTRYLAGSLTPEYRYSVFANRIANKVRPDEPNVSRCWNPVPTGFGSSSMSELSERILASDCDVVSIQYNFSLLSPGSMDALVSRLKERNMTVLATLHGTAHEKLGELAAALKKADAVIVHRVEEQQRLAATGLERVYLQRQGIYVPKHLDRLAPPGENPAVFTVSCFGFFLPPKGIYELLQAFDAAAFVNPGLRLKLVNALYDLPVSHAYAAECMRFIREHGLTDRVLMCAEFLDQETILRELSGSDLVVLPYTHSTESSSAAIRLPLASLTPVLCSDLDLFKEFAGIVHFYPRHDVIALANQLIGLSMDQATLRRFETRQREYVNELSWNNVALEFQSLVESCLQPEVRSAVYQ